MEWDRTAFNSRLELCLTQRGLTQKVFAKNIAIDSSAISEWKNKRVPLLQQLISSAQFLGVSPVWLAIGEGAMNAVEEELIKHWRVLQPEDREDFREHIARKAARTAAPKAAPKPRVSVPLTSKEHLHVETREHPGGQRVTTLDILAREEAAAYGLDPKPRRRDDRENLPVYHALNFHAGKAPRPAFAVAAGPGRTLELCDDLVQVRENHDNADIAYARVAGDSMLDTLLPGDVIRLRQIPPRGYVLPPLAENEAKNSLALLRNHVAHDSIWIVTINDEEPTLKRIQYDVRGGAQNWQLLIVADNPSAWMPRSVKRSDTVVFWAQCMGLVQ